MRPLKDENERFQGIVAPIAHEFDVFDAACAEVQCSDLAVNLHLAILLGRRVSPNLRTQVVQKLAKHFVLEVEVVDGLLAPCQEQSRANG